MAQKRDELLRTGGGNGLDRASFGARRFARGKLRSIIADFKERPQKIAVEVLAFRRRASTIVDHLNPDRAKKWLGPLDRAKKGATLEITLENLSFVDHPDTALDAIVALLRAEMGAREIRVHFDDDRCLDISPYLILGLLWGEMVPIFSGGRITNEMQKVIEAVRLRTALKMRRFPFLRPIEDVHAFPVHRRRPANSSRSPTRYLDPQTREKVQDNFVETLNDWLGQDGVDEELTPDGRANIKNIIGEVLDNAERHSVPVSMDGDWTFGGFMAVRTEEDGTQRYHCSIAFISIGASIADSLQTSSAAVAQAVDAYVARHRHITPIAVLRTVMAVQDGITRVAQSSDENRGGTGFQEVFDMVCELGATDKDGCDPKITIISGEACLKLHHPYFQGVRAENDPYAPREIWFNEANDSQLPPDASHAFALKRSFPGTIVTMSFYLDGGHLRGGDNADD